MLTYGVGISISLGQHGAYEERQKAGDRSTGSLGRQNGA